MAGIERILKAAKAAQKESVPDDAVFASTAPNVAELMTCKALKDGTARKPAQLSIWVGNGEWVGMLKCETEELICFCNCSTIAGIPAALESLITGPNPPWRPMNRPKGKGPQKKG